MKKKFFSPFYRKYLSEVLGINHYLCPENVYQLRALKGPLPCRFLAVLFQSPSPSQKELLKKIMAGLNVFEYSLLEIKDERVLNQLVFSQEKWADFVCFFGGKDLIKEGFLVERDGRLVLAHQKSAEGRGGSSVSSYLQVSPLKDMEGERLEVHKNKQKTWTLLKQWKGKL